MSDFEYNLVQYNRHISVFHVGKMRYYIKTRATDQHTPNLLSSTLRCEIAVVVFDPQSARQRPLILMRPIP